MKHIASTVILIVLSTPAFAFEEGQYKCTRLDKSTDNLSVKTVKINDEISMPFIRMRIGGTDRVVSGFATVERVGKMESMFLPGFESAVITFLDDGEAISTCKKAVQPQAAPNPPAPNSTR